MVILAFWHPWQGKPPSKAIKCGIGRAAVGDTYISSMLARADSDTAPYEKSINLMYVIVYGGGSHTHRRGHLNWPHNFSLCWGNLNNLQPHAKTIVKNGDWSGRRRPLG